MLPELVGYVMKGCKGPGIQGPYQGPVVPTLDFLAGAMRLLVRLKVWGLGLKALGYTVDYSRPQKLEAWKRHRKEHGN